MARIESRPPYDASFPQAGSGEFSRIAQKAAKKRSEEKEQEQAQERAYAVTEPTPKEEAVEATPIEEPTLKEPIAKPKVKPMPFPRVSFQEDAPRAKKEEQKPKAKPMPFPRYDFQEDAPWAVNGVTPQKKAEKPSATKKRETTNIGADLDPHIVAGHQVSFQEDAPWAKDNPYAFGLEQGFRNQNKFAGKSYEDLDKDAVVTSNSLTMGVIGSDPVIKKELNRRKQRLNDFTLIASAPEALAEYGITLSPETRARIENEIRLGTDSLKDLTPLLQKAKRVKYEEGKEKQRTISQVSDRAYQLEREMKRAGATKEADKAMKSDATMAMMLPSPTSAQIWKTTSYNDKLPDTYRAAMQLQEHANELSQLNKSFLSNLETSKNWASGAWEGFKNNILTRKAWQDKEGNTYAANEMALYRVIQAYNNGDNSPEVKKVVEMAAELNSAEAFMRSLLPKGYEAGESTAGSIPFMIDFLVTSALTGGAGSAEKAASKVGASGVKALATRGILTASGKGTRFLELLARYGQKAAQGVKGVATAVAEKAPGVTRMGGRIVKDATKAAIMTATLNAPSVASDAERRVTPIPYKLEGDLSDISDFIPINDDHILMEKRFMERNRSKALRKAFTSQWIENYSELAGGHFDTYLKALGKLTNFSGTAAGKAIARLNNALSKAPVVGSVRRAANIQGLGGEFAEEIYGGMLNAWLVGDQSMKDVFDAKNMGTTLEALLPTQIAFGILGGGGHALSLAKNKRQLTQIDKQLKEEFGDTDDGGKRWETLTLSEQGKVLDGLTGVYRDAMRRSNEAKDDATRQNAVKEATYARLLFMRLGLQTRRSVLQGAEAEAKLTQTQEKFNTLKQEAENALKADVNRTTTDRAGNSVTVRYSDKEYSVYNTEGVTISQDEKGEPRLLGKGTLYLRAPETDGGSAEIIPAPSDQVEVIAVQPKEEVDAAIEQSAAAIAEAAIQPELAAQEAESTPTAQEGETKIVPIPTAQEGETKIAPIPAAQVSKQITPIAQEAESVPIAQEAESTPMAQEAESAPIAQEAESAPMSQEAESVPMSQEAESAPAVQETESAPMSQKAESAPISQEAESSPTMQEAETAPTTQKAESVPAAQEVKNVPMAQEAKSAPQEKEQPKEAKVVSTPEQRDSVASEKTQNEEETISLPKEKEPLEKENYGRTERTTERGSAADSRLGKETRSQGDGTTGDSLHGSGSEHSVDTVQRSTGIHSGRTTDLKETSTSAKTAEGANASQGNLQNAFVPSAFVLPQTERERLEANIDALILLYEIEASARKATPKEQEILAKYTGWGGLSNSLFSFLANEKRNATERSQRLNEFIDDKELIGIVRNAETAFYTPGYVCDALWDIAKRLGFKGGNVLEPAMGVGRIIQHMPNSLRKSVSLSGYEKDDFSGRIARLLYPNAAIEVDGYENEPLKHPYDLIMANVPFGQNAPYDKKLSRKLMRELGKAYNLHNFFIAKGFNSLSDGGVAIYITSRHTLDSACNKLRSYAKEKGIDFLGAIRLPSDTFTGTGTAVVSDILVFRKRRDGEEPIDIKYLGLKDLPDSEVVQYDDTPFAVNEYFDTHPQQVLGTYRGVRERNNYMPQRVFKGNLTLYAFPDKEPAKELQEAIKRLDLKKGKINSELREQPTEEQPFQEGRLSVVGDEVYRYADGEKSCIIGEGGVAADTFRHKGKKIKSVEAVKAYIGLRDLLLAQVELESKADATDKEIEKHRKLLSDAYNAYTQQYGFVTEHNEIKSILEEDADSYLIFGLEHTENTLVQDEKTGKVRLARELKTRGESILEQRTCFPTREPDKADNITDAVNISRAYKNGLDGDYIANLLGTDVEHVRRELVAHGYAYEDPTTNEIVDSVEYLSGDVVTKLAEAKENNEQGKYDHNIEALTAVQPERVIYSNIAVSLQSTWIPKEIKENFLREKICEYNVDLYEDPVSGEHRVARFISGEIFSGLPAGVFTKKRYPNEITNFALSARPTSLWKITKDTGVKDNRGNSIRVPDEEAMNAVKVTVERIKQMFVDWLEEKEEHRTKLEDIYNEKFNRQRLPEHPIPQIEYYPNASHEIKLYDHQKKAVSRALSQSTLFAHEVGTGKTFTMVTTAMEMRRLGLAKKPMIVVQNATIGGFVTDARKLYPQAKILAPGKRDMSAENRKRLLGKIATGDYDMVIVPTSFLKLIPDSKEAREDYYNSLKEQFREKIEAAQNNNDSSACRELQKSLCKLMEDEAKATEKAEQALNKKTDRRTDDILTFDKLNVDALFLDEAHQYKKLGLITNLGQIKGVDTQSSEQAVSAYLKILDVRRKSGGKNVILATGTPVSNTMAEIWTMMRYINPDVLETYGMTNFDDFASTYGEITEDLEYKMDQTFKPVARFKKFVHLNELLTAWRMCADVVRTLDVKELQQGNRIPKLKGGKYTQVVLPKGDALNDAILQIVDAIEENEKQHGDDKLPALNVVAHTLAKQASIDLRLLNPAFPNEPSSKTNAAVQKIYEKYKETDDIKGTQLVFLDIFQSKDPSKGSSSSAYDIFHAGDADTRFNAYEYIRDELVKKGIPRNEIACITDIKDGQTADVKREALFEKVRNGEVRVLLGSTEKMGVGVNVQTRLCALHHLDIVNRPMDFAQRNGRMLRNGNTLAKMGREVEIFVYGTEETLDAASYNRLLSKLNFTAPVMAPLNASVSETEDVSDENALQMTSAELTAALSGSTTAVDLHEAQDKLQMLTTEKKMHDRKRDENSARLRQYTSDIAVLPKLIEDTKAAEQMLQASHPALYSETQGEGKSHTSAQGWYKDVYIDGKKTKEPLNELTKYIDKIKGSLTRTSKEGNEIRIDNDITIKIGSRSLGEAYIEQITVGGVAVPMNVLSDRNTLSNGQGLITRVYNKLTRDFIRVEAPRLEHSLAKKTAFVDGYKDLGAFPKLNELHAVEEQVATLKQKLAEEGKMIEAERARRRAERSEQGSSDTEEPTDEAFRIGNEPSEKRISERTWHKLVDRLGKSGLATEFVTDSKAFSEKLNSLKRSERELIGGKTVFGFVDKRTGVVYLNPETMDANTPLHECAHLWNALIRTANPELWARGRYLIEQSPYAFDVRNEGSYSGLSAEERADEALARAIADRGEKILKQSGMRGLALRAWIRDVWQHILAFFGIKKKAKTLNDLTDMALGDLLNGQAESYEIPKEEEASQILFRIGNKRRAEYRDRLRKKRTDLSDVAIEKTLDAIEAFGEEEAGDKGDSKLETLALHWTLNGSIDLTREANEKDLDDIPDSTLVRQAAEAARRKKVDPMQYDSPKTLLSDIAEGMTFDKRLDPDKEPCFTARHEVPGTDIVVYDVANNKKGQRAVRAFVDSHWGVNANPWCLITRNTDAANFWRHYSYIQKRIAFQNGKLLAFKACDSDGKQEPWWNRQDRCTQGVPFRKDLGGEKYLPLVVNEVTGAPIGDAPKYALRGERGGNLYEEWTPNGKHLLLRETHEGPYKKTFERWTEDGALIERNKQKNGHLEENQWYSSGQRKYLSIDTGRGRVSSSWHENGNRESFSLSKPGNYYYVEWYENGQRQLIKTDSNDEQHIERWYENGQPKEITSQNSESYRRESWHENGQRALLDTHDRDGNRHIERWNENGHRSSLKATNKEGNERIERWYENGQHSSLEITDKEGNSRKEAWYENGQHSSLDIINKEGDRRLERWYENGQRKLLETTDKGENLCREIWNEDGDRIGLETRDNEGDRCKESWDEKGIRRNLSIVKRNCNVIYEIWFDERGEVVSADYINYRSEIRFQRKNGEFTETARVGSQNSEEALREMAQAFLEETGEELRFPGAKPLATDVQYRKGKQVTLTDVKGNSLTVRLSDEKDRNGNPYVLTSDGKLSYGVIPGGLVPEEPKTKEVRLSLGNDVREKGTYRYGLVHIMEDHYAQMKSFGFDTVEAYIKHILNNIGEAVFEKRYEGKTTHFVFTVPFPSRSHPSRENTDSLLVEIGDESDHWEVISTWRTGKSFIEKKKKEAEAAVPAIGLPHATNVAEGHQNGTTESSNSAVVAGTQNLPLSTDKDTKKINNTNEAWEAIDNPQSAADEVTQHDVYRDALTAQYGEATRDVEADKTRKQQVAEDALRKLGLEGVEVEVVSRSDVAEAYARDAMGWHDRKTGKVTIVAENNELEDIEATVLHEVVGHHGLEALLGKKGLATLTHEVLPLIPEAERKRLEDTYGTNEQTIAEEYIAGMAEQYTPPSLWARIAGFIRNALRRIGFRLPLTNGDLLYLTWRGIRATRKEQSSTDTLLHRADEKRVIARCQELDDIQFRKPRKQILSELAADGVDEKGVLKLTDAMNELLEKRVYKLRETWQNDTQSFIELARCVEAATGETIPDEMNIDKVYNQSASKAFARQEETRKKYDRMMQAVRYFARNAQLSPEMTELYFLAKHAPERNAEMRRRAEELFDPTTRTEEQEEILNDYYSKLFPSWNKQNGEAYASEAEAREAFFDALKEALIHKDYAAEEAITERIATLIKQDKKSPYKAITDEGNLLNAFTEAVEARAGHQDVYHVWQLVNGFNRGTIELWRNSGMIDEETYRKVTEMFEHYVPMQGWKENTNQTPWEYTIRTHIDTNPLKTMHGRQSLPGSPFEAMLKSAMNSIVAATRNEERQALYFFAQRYGSDYLSASSAWYVLQQEGDTKRWVEAYPETVTHKTEKGDAIESTTQETAEAFFARMKELEAKGLARQRTQSTRPETGYLLSERQEQEHVVPLFFDGQKYNVFVNGNPRFSRAATRHNRASDANGAADKLLRSVRWFTREMGQNITGRSLSFGAANMVRDLLFAEMSSSTIYGTRYALAFNRAYFTDVIPLMLGLKKGDTARLYNEYKANGGRTGFAFLTGDKRSARSTRNALSNSLTARAGRAGRSFWNAYMGINEHLEDMSRFAAYAAARKMGLGITEATHRAKSITVNFNKRGTGNSPMYQFLSTLYLFFNANLQGVALTGKMFRDHPKRAAAWSIGLILLQPLMTLLYTALANPDGDDGDDEDETLQEKYDRLPLKDVNPFLRRSNICIPLGEGKLIKVPLSPEMRALNGIGVTLSDMLMGRATSGDLALATIDGALNSSSIGLDASISSFTDANELAERGENGALYTALRGAVPSALQPFGDIAANRDWSGRRIYGESVYHRGTPSYLYADKTTPRWMTNAAAGWNTMLYGQGDKHIGEVSTGLLSVNPSSVNYLAERYLGGILEFVTDLNRATDMLTDKNEGSVSQALGQAPVTRRFWKDDPLMQGSEARRNFYSTRRALRQDIERIDRMRRNAKNADYKEANEIRNSIRTYLDGRNEMQLRYLAKRFDALSDTMQAHDETYAGKDTETRLSVRERDTRAIERLLKEAERLEAVTK